MRRLAWTLSLLCAWGFAARASSLEPRDLAQRARQADRIALVEVLGSEVHVPGGDPRHMTTVTSVVVLEDYKGRGPRMVRITQLGGQSGLWSLKVSGAPTLVPGETAVLFLRCRDAAHPDACTLDGLAEGKVEVVGAIGQQDALVPAVRGGPSRIQLEQLADRIRAALSRGGR